ncbi:unnamed protein product, partial [Ectocarpus sp. 12 AP-2014]
MHTQPHVHICLPFLITKKFIPPLIVTDRRSQLKYQAIDKMLPRKAEAHPADFVVCKRGVASPSLYAASRLNLYRNICPDEGRQEVIYPAAAGDVCVCHGQHVTCSFSRRVSSSVTSVTSITSTSTVREERSNGGRLASALLPLLCRGLTRRKDDESRRLLHPLTAAA